jgi:hypothetical protein
MATGGDYVQNAVGTVASGTTSPTVTLNGVVSGNVVALWICGKGINITVFTVSGGGLTWTRQIYISSDPTSNAWFTATASTTGNLTITANKNGNSGDAACGAYECYAPAAENDGTPVSGQSSANGSLTFTTPSQAFTNDMILAAGSSYDQAHDPTFTTPASGFTAPANSSVNDTGTLMQCVTQYMVTTTSGTHTAGWSSLSNGTFRTIGYSGICIKGSDASAVVVPVIYTQSRQRRM